MSTSPEHAAHPPLTPTFCRVSVIPKMTTPPAVFAKAQTALATADRSPSPRLNSVRSVSPVPMRSRTSSHSISVPYESAAMKACRVE